jgi:hypothetical protein
LNNNQLLFHLIEKSFKQEKFQFEALDELTLTKIIFENGLVGLVYQSIDQSTFKMQKYYQMLSQAFGSFVSKDIQQQAIIEDLKKHFNQHEIKHVFLKGAHLKQLYLESYMRGMGDIDCVVPKTDFECAKQILINAGYTFKSATSHHHVFETLDGNYIELHQSITSSSEYENEVFLNQLWSNVYLDNDYTYKLLPEFEYVYLLTHLIRHIRTSGVGIRSLLDIQVYYDYYCDTIDKKTLNGYLKTYKLDVFNQKVMHLNQIFLNQVEPKPEDLAIMDYIMQSGIHGSGTMHDPYITKRTFEQTRLKKSRLRFFLSEVFPSRKRLQEAYPYLKKHPWLLPWAWFVRIFKQLFKIKNTQKRLKSVSNDSEIDTVKKIYDYLGI